MSQDTIREYLADSIHIIDITNKSEYIEIANGNNTSNNLLSTLENQSFSAVRSGGPSVLSTILHRGMASRHVAVLWGGFNIQSVVNGTYDLGLIRNIFDEVKVYNNGTTSATGNASMAGALSLGNHSFKKNLTNIRLSANTIYNLSGTLINKFSTKKYNHHFALNRTADQNEYVYKNGDVKFTQQMAEFSMWSLNYEGHFLASDKVSLTAGAWLQNADRDIPPTKTSVGQLQEQKDVNYRAYLQAAYYPSEKIKFNFRSAYFDELLDYQAPGISSIAESKIINNAIDLIHQSGLSLSIQHRNDRVEASFFDSTRTRNTVATLIDYNTALPKDIQFGISLRSEWVDQNRQPIGLGVRLSKHLSKQWTTSLRYNKGYTLPSFNDLYWPSGGNPELKTERSHAFELGLKYNPEENITSEFGLNIFYNIIDDWIQWTPIDGMFEPVNQRKVRNLGFETNISKSVSISKSSKLKFRVQYSFTDSRLAEHYLNSEHDGKRTIFVPQHKVNGQITWTNKIMDLHVRPLYYSKRYDTVDNSTSVPGFVVVDFEIAKTFMVDKREVLLSLTVENGLDNDYENIRFYPMPLRVVRLGLNIKL